MQIEITDRPYITPQFFIFVFITAEFGLYVLIRQLVNFKEWLVACKSFHAAWLLRQIVGLFNLFYRARVERSIEEEATRCSDLPSKSAIVNSVRSYLYLPLQEWKDAAEILDEYLHFNEWKMADEDPYYDWKLVKKVHIQIRYLIASIVLLKHHCCRSNVLLGAYARKMMSEAFSEFLRRAFVQILREWNHLGNSKSSLDFFSLPRTQSRLGCTAKYIF